MKLQRRAGLRVQEAMMSYASLESWLQQLDEGRPITVVFGTKGGRAREVKPFNQEGIREAIEEALEVVAQNGGYLIDKPSKKQAKDRYVNCLKAAGLVGQISSHSLRYRYACEQLKCYLDQGHNMKEALALVAMELGHGDGRGRYIKRVYARFFLEMLATEKAIQPSLFDEKEQIREADDEIAEDAEENLDLNGEIDDTEET